MLKLNPLQEQIDIQLNDLNTSYVEVKLSSKPRITTVFNNLNTSYVEVKPVASANLYTVI